MDARWTLLVLPLAAACSVVSPPPMRMLHEPVLRTDPGGVSVAVVGGSGGGVFLDDSAGGEGRLSLQATKELDLEVAAGAGARFGDDHDDVSGVPSMLGWGRVGGRYRPDHLDWVALRFGVGGGAADTGLSWATTDVGVSFGYSFLNRVRPYIGVSLGLSVPVDRGPQVREEEDGDWVPARPATTLWIGGGAGLSVRLVEGLELGVEGLLDLGWSTAGNESAIALGATGVLRYTFGPVRQGWPRGRHGAPRPRDDAPGGPPPEPPPADEPPAVPEPADAAPAPGPAPGPAPR